MNLLLRRRALLNLSEPFIPRQYQQVEYIQSTRKQVIDTKFKATNNTRIELVLKFADRIVNSTNASFFGAYDTENAFTINFGAAVEQAYELFFWVNKRSALGGTYSSKKITADIVLNKNTFIITNDRATYGDISVGLTKGDWETMATSLRLFGYLNGVYVEKPHNMYEMFLYGAKFWDNDILVRDYIPCYRKSDNVAGLYDRVTKEFYYSEGTDNFVVGGNVDVL